MSKRIPVPLVFMEPEQTLIRQAEKTERAARLLRLVVLGVIHDDGSQPDEAEWSLLEELSGALHVMTLHVSALARGEPVP